jgi:hypothetical protein
MKNKISVKHQASNRFLILKLIVGIYFGFWILTFGFSAQAVVDIGEIGVGARPLGMGKASVGGLDDATAIFTNPAALPLNQNLNLISMSGTLLSDINYVMLGVAHDFPFGRFGIGYVNASIGGIPITEIVGTGTTETVVQTGSSDYSSSVLNFSYATRLSRIFRGRADNFIVGLNLKYFMQGFSGGGTSLRDATGTGMDADLGVIWEYNSWMNLGMAFNNFLPMDFGGSFDWDRSGEKESIPMAFRVGGNFKVLGENGLLQKGDHKLNLLLEFEDGRGESRPSTWHTGIEYFPIDMLAFRLGIDQKPKATESGTGIDNNFTAGLGLKFMGFTFDYAYHQFGDMTENATHFFSFGYRGIEEKVEKEKKVEEKVKEEKEEGMLVTEVVPKPALKTFKDLPEKYWAKRPIEYLATLGIMNGYPDQTFRPDGELTRGELAALLVKAKGFKLEKVTKSSFSDIKPSSWVSPYVEVAVKRDYVKGYPDGTFKPGQKITRAEAAMVFAKFSGLYVKPKVTQKPFADLPVDHWAAPAVAADKAEGLYEYLGAKDFEPDKNLTRAEAAEILSKTPMIKEKIKELISGE